MSGVRASDVQSFKQRHQRFKARLLEETEEALVSVRTDVMETAARVLGSVSEKGGATSVIPSAYAVVWAALSKEWSAFKRRAKLLAPEGMATGDLMTFLKSLAVAPPDATHSKDGIAFNDIFVSDQPGEKLYQSNTSQWFKFFAFELGTDRGQPARPFFIPVVLWFKDRLRAKDTRVMGPFNRAIRVAKEAVHGG